MGYGLSVYFSLEEMVKLFLIVTIPFLLSFALDENSNFSLSGLRVKGPIV